MGNLFVGEQPLAESPMKDHPLTPMRDSNLMRLLQAQVTSPVGLANRLVVAKGPQALRERLARLQPTASPMSSSTRWPMTTFIPSPKPVAT